jgi:hypothetical protein
LAGSDDVAACATRAARSRPLAGRADRAPAAPRPTLDDDVRIGVDVDPEPGRARGAPPTGRAVLTTYSAKRLLRHRGPPCGRRVSDPARAPRRSSLSRPCLHRCRGWELHLDLGRIRSTRVGVPHRGLRANAPEGCLRLFQAEGWRTYVDDPERTHRAFTGPGSTALVGLVDGRVVAICQLQSDGHVQAT